MSAEIDAVVRIEPNEGLYVGPGVLAPHLGELAQAIMDLEPRLNVSVGIDAGRRIREGEVRAGGATPLEAVAIFVAVTAGGTASRLFARELDGIADRCFEAAVAWIRRRRSKSSSEEVIVTLYGPDGRVLRDVLVDLRGNAVDRAY